MIFLSSADFFHLKKKKKKKIRNIIRVSNSLDPDQALLSVGPDLGLNGLQRSLADNKICC